MGVEWFEVLLKRPAPGIWATGADAIPETFNRFGRAIMGGFPMPPADIIALAFAANMLLTAALLTT